MAAPVRSIDHAPFILFEDDHLLVVNKPAGLNTHAPSPFAGEGIYDWLRHREPRWATLALIHRLDKETSGVLVFAKSPEANRSLTEQFTRHVIRKKYLMLTDRVVRQREFTIVSALVRSGEKYLSRPLHAGAARAETRFRVLSFSGGLTVLEAEPVTGRTHQIRVHAAAQGLPVLGDILYGGTPAGRLYLHAEELTLEHPASGAELTFRAPPDFLEEEIDAPGRRPALLARRSATIADLLIDPQETNAYRLIHGASSGWPGWSLDRLGDYLFSQSERPLSAEQIQLMEKLILSPPTLHAPRSTLHVPCPRGAYHQGLQRTVTDASPQHILGESAPDRFPVRENGVEFELSFREGQSVGLFLDQRDNRRRLLINHVAAHFPAFTTSPAGSEVLNTFAYTCGFSVCAAKAGAKTTSIDLSRKYLEWGKRNFAANQLDPASHDFIFGDVFDWLRRLAKKERRFDVIVLDPPTFSRSKEAGTFQAEKDYGKLVLASLPVLRSGGLLFASTNAAAWKPEQFLAAITSAASSARRQILQEHYVPQPADFPINRAEPAYLKTVWIRVR